ncbi:MAG TPA: hypothetical protein VL133_11525, partial [Devosia sp.]|nr:hypothetical protein [Devosia sp.]
TDIGHDHLDGGLMAEAAKASKKARQLKYPKECPSCHALKPAGVHACPECGFAPVRREDVATADGELFQVAGAKLADDRQTKQRFWSGCLWHVDNRGWSMSRAKANYHQRFGVWPVGLSAKAEYPDVATRNWIKASVIRWAKGKEKARKASEAMTDAPV